MSEDQSRSSLRQIERCVLDPEQFDPWNPHLHDQDGGDAFAALMASLRAFVDVFSSSRPNQEQMAEVGAELQRLTAILQPASVGGSDPDESGVSLGFAGRRYDLPGRGHPLLVPLVITEWSSEAIAGGVTFGPQHLGGNYAVHGGILAQLFDEVLGRLSNTNRQTRCRTAYLHIDYRKVVLIGQPFRLEAKIDRVEGRKRFLSAQLTDPHGDVATEAHGLFVDLRDEQP